MGGVISPLLANIYLDRLDKFVETMLLPAHNRGTKRRLNLAYKRKKRMAQYYRSKGRYENADELLKAAQKLPSGDPDDPNYRRLHYARYTDDFLLGFNGPREEAEEIKRRIGGFLRDRLKLELSERKTLITHARSEAARFLGYEIVTLHDDTRRDWRGQRSLNGNIGLRVPADVIREKCRAYTQNGKPIHRTERMHDDAFSIVAKYQQEYRGVVEYYRLAYNLHRLNDLRWVMETSLAKTLASKLKISCTKVYDKYRTTIASGSQSYKVLQVVVEREGKRPLVAQWGGIPLKWDKNAVLNDQPAIVWNARTELIERLLADTCELCGSNENVEVHHVRKLKDLQTGSGKAKARWVQLMAARQRKTLATCERCHEAIHAGRPVGERGLTGKTQTKRV